MILLTSTSDKLNVNFTSGSIKTNSSWLDNNAGSITPGRTNGVTTTTVVLITAGTTWTVPSDWTDTNTIETYGAGGSGGMLSGGLGGGGGAYSKISNLAGLIAGASINIGVGVGGVADISTGVGNNGGNTWFNGSSAIACSCGAEGGKGPTSGTPAVGGNTANGTGTTKRNGGIGGGSAFSTGAGGGSAAGPTSLGSTGNDSTAGSGGNGQAGDGGSGGAAGSGSSSGNGTSGSAGTAPDYSGGSGGGGFTGFSGGNGGAYGGGGGGGGLASGNGGNGNGGAGGIVVTYTSGVIDAMGSPSTSVQRTLESLTIRNTSTTLSTRLKIQHYDGTNTVDLTPNITLLPSEQIAIDERGKIIRSNTTGGRYLPVMPNTRPSLSGYLAETYPRELCPETAGTFVASGAMGFQSIFLTAGTVVSNITFCSGAASSASTHWWFCLYGPAGNLLTKSADQTSTVWAATTVLTLAMSPSYIVPTSDTYYLTLLMVATTVPTLKGFTTTGTLASLNPVQNGTAGSSLTTPPSMMTSIFSGSAFAWGAVS